MKLLKGYTTQEKSWMMYDWANSAHSVIVVTILPIFYDSLKTNSVSAMADWGASASIAMLIIAILAPILGVLGDFQHWKKRLFTGFVILGVIACAAMAPTPYMAVSSGAETVGAIVLLLYIISTIGFAGANLFYDSFLTDITTDDRMDRVSLMGYGLGYIGGSTIPLVIFLLMNLIGLPMNLCLSVAFGLTAVWWAVFTIPMWKNVHQVHYIPRRKGMVAESIRNLVATAKRIFQNKRMFVFLLAYFFYIDGVGTIIRMSTSYGSALGINATMMLLALLLVQVLGLPFAMLYTKLAARYGARAMVGVGICVYMFICVFGFFISTAWHFWVLAVLVSTSQGGIQALSRSIFTRMIPDKDRSSEFFGFYDIFGKFSSIIGPALMGAVAGHMGTVLMNRQGITEATATVAQLDAISLQAAPYGVLSVLAIFIVGGVLYFVVLPRVEKKTGIHHADQQ